MAGFDARLVAYTAQGTRLGVLRSLLALQVSVTRGEDASASATAVAATEREAVILARTLESGTDLALEVAGPSGWVEPPGGRYMLLRRRRHPIRKDLTYDLTMAGYSWLLRKMVQLGTSGLNADGKRSFSGARAGLILRTLIQENHAEGVGTGLLYDFTTATDSAGQAWSKVAGQIAYEPGLDLWTILDNLDRQGLCEWRITGRTLQVYNPGTVLRIDKSTGLAPVVLHPGRDVVEGPTDETLEDLIGLVMIQGDEGLRVVERNPSAPAPWGAFATAVSHGGISDEGTARALVQSELDRGSRVRGQYTQTVQLADARVLPLVDYHPGDFIKAPGRDGQLESLRVQQVTLTRGQDGAVEAHLTLNDRFVDKDVRQARRMTGITGGATVTGGSGGRPAPEGPDRRQPAAPQGLVVQSNAYIDTSGEPRGQVTAVWDEVTTATNGTALEVTDYQLWGRPNVTGAPWRHLTGSEGTRADYSPLPVGESWAVRVRARGRYTSVPGAWSPVVTVTIASDTTPPPAPSAPALSSALGIVPVEWDGLTSVGTQMPIDFDRAEIVASLTTVSGDGKVVGELRRAGTWVVSGYDPGATLYVWLRAYDTSGNASALSPRRQVVVQSVRDADLASTTIQQQITNLATGPLDGARVMPGTLRVDALTVGIGNRIVDPFFADPRIWDLRTAASTSTVGWSTTTYQPGSARSAQVTGTGYVSLSPTGGMFDDLVPVEPGSKVYMAVAAWATSVPFRFAYAFRRANGTTSMAAVGSTLNAPPVTPSRWFEYVFTVPSDVVAMQMLLYTSTTGTLYFERPYWQPQASGVLIQDDTVTAPKLVADSVGVREARANELWADSAWIGLARLRVLIANIVEAEHIAGDAITAKHTITGARVQTLAQANRGIELHLNQLRAYDNVGNRRTLISGSTGQIDTTGRIISGDPTGINTEVTPNAYGNRPGVRFDHGTAVGLQPVIYSVGSGVDDYPFRSLVMHGSEATINSSGRAELVLEHGGDFKLARSYGSASGTGIHVKDRYLDVQGRHRGGSNAHIAQQLSEQVGPASVNGDSALAWTITYAAPTPVGARGVIASARAEGASVTFHRAQVGVTNVSAGGFRAVVAPSSGSGGQWRVEYLATWR